MSRNTFSSENIHTYLQYYILSNINSSKIEKKLAQERKQQKNRLMTNTFFIRLQTRGVNNSARSNDYRYIFRFSSMLRKLSILTGRVIS